MPPVAHRRVVPTAPHQAGSAQNTPLGLRPSDQWVLAVVALCCLVVLSVRLYRTWGPAPVEVRIESELPPQLDDRLDINVAEWPALTLLPGVSDRLAQRIVEERRAGGLFRTPQDLQRVSGIGPKLAQRLGPHLTGWRE